jgi:3'-5' exoribonuclease
MQRPSLKAVLALFFEDPAFRRQYEQCPASVNGHHARLGGLLQHTWEVAAMAREICRITTADEDLTLAGALLHDIGKLDAYQWLGAFEHTTAGSLCGHVMLGSLSLDRRLRQAPLRICTDEELALLHHLILSHHGKREFGSPVEPMTLEAEILHHADHASARAESMEEALSDEANFAAGGLVSARSLWQLDGRRVFRGKSTWGL